MSSFEDNIIYLENLSGDYWQTIRIALDFKNMVVYMLTCYVLLSELYLEKNV